eukprot:CAMPEP_0119496008 /NCGR_PEP_ID=MMETSP1344-20130328/19467_1 /TAXON_ID=236787 /ORGANISM="Florenciella parvula, Strain CCMP2471" /LENGTH=700 /DNA_ID=CAMNT_0007531651 /DNA_START=135 /DNA_END=2237 /DNA_ORIENTATION=+
MDLDVLFVLFGAMVVFYMQVGFTMFEVGSVRSKNTKNILLKNILDVSIGAMTWCCVGYGLAFGRSYHGVIGVSDFIIHTTKGGDRPSSEVPDDQADYTDDAMAYAKWLFQWAFAATSSTIVSGAVAERIRFKAYMVISTVLTGFVYAVVVHVTWTDNGLFSNAREQAIFGCGALDFAGSGVVHAVGGFSALWGICALGPRAGVTFTARFPYRKAAPPPQSTEFQCLGVMLLWFSWFGFNGCSAMFIHGDSVEAAARSMVMTALAGVTGAVTSIAISGFVLGADQILLSNLLNGILSGLVSITACCATVEVEGAFLVGAGSAVVYHAGDQLMLKLGIDDVVNAVTVHGFNGVWGLLATGLLSSRRGYHRTFNPELASHCCGVMYGCGWSQFGANAVYAVLLATWTLLTSGSLCFVLRQLSQLRVDSLDEQVGMDELLHFEGDMLMVEDEMDAPRRGGTRRNLERDYDGVTGGAIDGVNVEDEMDAQPRGGAQRAIVTMVGGTDDGYDHSISGGGMDGVMTRHTTGGYDDGQLSWEQPVHLSHLTMLKVAQPHHNTTTTMGVGMGVGVGIEQATMAPNTIPHASPGTGARRSLSAVTFDSLSTEGTRSDSEAPPAWAQREEGSPEFSFAAPAPTYKREGPSRNRDGATASAGTTTGGTTTGGTTATEGPSLTRGSSSSDLPGESGAASGSASIRTGWNESPD